MTNRLADESSPYLLQHAHNPVHWQPWDARAIEDARSRNVPIFLSIGYSTCYWCHVMERECFENPAIARQMNDHFVCIKVDREERPDLDDAYMAAVQMLTGHGGWPMSVFIDPRTLSPFWAGTYFPPAPARGMPSFPQVLERMSGAYKLRPGEVAKQAQAVADAVAERLAPNAHPVAIGPEQVGMAVQTLLTIFDRADGGFGRAPKFPQPVYAELLLAVRGHLSDPGQQAAVDHALTMTLDRMALGGIFDHVAGGFHRYSVDAYWLVPHFEKMLYDNAQLLSVYAQASAHYNDPFYAHTARRTADYVLTEMLQPSGAFSTAQDAEVGGREGQNYLWTPEQIRDALPPENATLALDIFGLNSGTNFTDPHHPNAPASNVLHLSARPSAHAVRLGMSAEQLQHRLDAINTRLYAVRQKRPQPRLDDKVLTSWNGLMIASLARAGRLLSQPRYHAAAAKAADWLLAHHTHPTLGLIRTSRALGNGAHATPGPTIAAGLEDFAMFAEGLLELARTDARFLTPARALLDDALSRFADGKGNHLDAQPQPGQPPLFITPRSTYDGAIPSGNSALANALLTLADITGQHPPREHAAAVLTSISNAVAESPIATANSTRALLRLLTSDEGTLHKAQQRAGAVAHQNPLPDDLGIQVHASADEVILTPDQPAEMHLRIVIPPGLHINDAYAGDDSAGTLTPLRVAITGGTGVAVYADYPKGSKAPARDRTPGIHEGTIDLPIALELTGDWTGHPALAVTFQPCTNNACLLPQQITLDVHLTKP